MEEIENKEELQKFMGETVKTATIDELVNFSYKVITAEKYDWLIQITNAFLQQQFKEKK